MGSVYSSSPSADSGYSSGGSDFASLSCSSDSTPSRREPNFIGLHNLGNTCYANAVIQALYFCPAFRNRVLDYRRLLAEKGVRKENLLVALADLYHMIDFNERRVGAVTPIRFVIKLKQSSDFFDNFRQQDAHELLSHLLNSIPEAPPPKAKVAPTQPQRPKQSSQSSVAVANDDAMEENGFESAQRETSDVDLKSDKAEESTPKVEVKCPEQAEAMQVDEDVRLVEKVVDGSDEEDHMREEEMRIRAEMEARLRRMELKLKEIANYPASICDVFVGKLLSCVTCQCCKCNSKTNEPFFDLSLSIPTTEQLEQMDRCLTEKLSPSTISQGPSQESQATSNGSIAVQAASSNSRPRQGELATPNVYVSYMQWFFSLASEQSQKLLRVGWSLLVGMATSLIRDFFSTGSIPLEACLKCFFTSDQLDGDDRYACEKCSELTSGVKHCQLMKLPAILCIQLKRFRHEGLRHNYTTKINTAVSFPLDELDMTPYCSEELLGEVEENGGGGTHYQLVSFISHFGNSIDYGHYVAYCRSDYDQQWYEYDDSRVTQVNDAEVAGKEAYVLFYERKTPQVQERNEEMNSVGPITTTASSEEQGDEPGSDEDEWASAL